MNDVRKLRRIKDISQYELGKKTRIAQSTLSLIERHYREPSLKMMKKIANALGCPLEEVFPNYRGKSKKRSQS